MAAVQRHLGLVELGASLAVRPRPNRPSRKDPRTGRPAVGRSWLAAPRMPLVEARPGLERHRPRHEVVNADHLLFVALTNGGSVGPAVHLVQLQCVSYNSLLRLHCFVQLYNCAVQLRCARLAPRADWSALFFFFLFSFGRMELC